MVGDAQIDAGWGKGGSTAYRDGRQLDGVRLRRRRWRGGARGRLPGWMEAAPDLEGIGAGGRQGVGAAPRVWGEGVRMSADRVRFGYPRFSVLRFSGLVLVFRPRFCGFGYPKYRGFGADANFHPWCSIGSPKDAAQQRPS
jgi:hypothetical protein